MNNDLILGIVFGYIIYDFTELIFSMIKEIMEEKRNKIKVTVK